MGLGLLGATIQLGSHTCMEVHIVRNALEESGRIWETFGNTEETE